MNDFKRIKESTIASLDHMIGMPHLRQILESELDDINVGRGYYATSECFANRCGYPRVYFGKCMAEYRDQVAATHLRKILT